ncbi:hypothetical protein [Geoalkalibacter halelectricus]|uniref:hypothetical protein n=1 Tax=Geoalkalibacter halelectricus TaxID=2847045 RepID=UPI00266F2972|nr:hypothetical protein [Geoalkalibacter halelectricus]MDO3379712.1 hypothetical protein [Geoalkalibacter halelectricus]
MINDKGNEFMTTIKDKMKDIIQSQPDDSTYEEILRELAFARIVDLGMSDYRNCRVVSNDEMEHRIRTWQK